jgi:hypothetical protein
MGPMTQLKPFAHRFFRTKRGRDNLLWADTKLPKKQAESVTEPAEGDTKKLRLPLLPADCNCP